jgi:hypothetical protein
LDECKELHKISKSFDKKFINIDEKEKFSGWPLIQAIEKWAKKHPTVKILRCDDTMFMSSILVMIPHETEDHYMGHTMVYVPQDAHVRLSECFLYPSDTNELFNVLSEILSPKNTIKYQPYFGD